MSIVTINGVALDTLYADPTDLTGVFSAPPAEWQSVAIPYRPGVFLTRAAPQVGARVLEIQVLLRGTDAADAEDKLQDLKALVYARASTIEFDWMINPARLYIGYCQAVEASFFAVGITGWLTVSLSFLLLDPYAVESAQQSVTVTPTASASIMVGTAPTEAIVTVSGAATNPTVIWRDYTGTELGRIETTLTLAAADALVIDAREGGSVVVTRSGTPENGLQYVSNATYTFPVIPLSAVDPVTPTWATVNSSGGSSMNVVYSRMYL
jgi:hypothetical protein